MKKPIIVRQNGKRLNQKYNKSYTNNTNLSEFHRDQAATLHESEEDSIPVFARPTDTYKKQPKENKGKFSYFKPIIIAILSALAIGTLLGIIMLRMFVGIDSDLSAQGSNLLSVVNNDEKNDRSKTMTLSDEPMEAYVLQAGVFSEKENANTWAMTYGEAGLPTMIWEKENQHFLLLGLANTEEQAKVVAEGLKADSFDVYVKKWRTEAEKVKLSETEQEWFQSFRDQWNNALTSLSSQEALSPAEWDNVITNYPKESERASSLFEGISNIEQVDGMEAQIVLLNLWNDYEVALK